MLSWLTVGVADSRPQEEKSSGGVSFFTAETGVGGTGNWIGSSPRERERELEDFLTMCTRGRMTNMHLRSGELV